MINIRRRETNSGMEDLRRGRLDASPYYFEVDFPFFQKELKRFLPEQIIDFHAHVVGPEALNPAAALPVFWAERVCPNGMTLPSLLESYAIMFHGRYVRPVVFGHPSARFDLERENEYVADQARRLGLWPLILTRSTWSESELERRVEEGEFVGLKPYPIRAAQDETSYHRSPNQIEIYDFLPRSHLKLADKKRWVVILHIPRTGRLDDPTNIRQLLEIDENYPNAIVVVAHVGRAYCPGQGERGLKALQHTQNLFFDISANTNQSIFKRLIETIGPGRILFGSDMPITAMHAKRICERNNYVNIVLNADWEDSHTKAGCPEDGITFFLYEEIAAFKKAAEECGLSRRDTRKVFFSNAEKILATK